MSGNTIGKSCYIATGKLDANQAIVDGEFPFFTCAEFPDTIDSYSFDDDVVLVAGNNARGNFHVSRYNGKFNAYQRTYVLTAKDDIDIDYVYYALKLELKRLREKAQGSQTKFLTMPILTGINLSNIEHKKQTTISKVLARLDKKIELNNKINAELEAMAKLIYDYWFVQFDFPDANGKPYKSSGGKMVYNEALKREIPDGWGGAKIGDVLCSELGGTPLTKIREYWTGNIPWLNSGEIANFPIIEAEEYINSNAIAKSATSLMPKGTCVLSITRHLRPSILAVDACANQSVVGIYENEELKSSYLYPYLKNEIPRLMSLRTGAQQPHINKGIVDASPITLPSDKILKSYYKKVAAIYKQLNNNAFQNKELTELRDWLLPMLMNGQVTVTDSSQ